MKNNKNFRGLILLLSISIYTFCMNQIVYCQNAITPNFSIELSLIKELSDQKGTDVKNIYTIIVDVGGTNFANKDIYTVQYSIDGQPIESFLHVVLPFSFKRNFKGLLDGIHEIRVDVEDNDENILATNFVRITVGH